MTLQRKEMRLSKLQIIIIIIYRGLCKAITFNPKGTFASFVFLCDAICLFDKAPDDLESLFQDIIRSFNLTFKDKFKEMLSTFPEKLKAKMFQRFKLSEEETNN